MALWQWPAALAAQTGAVTGTVTDATTGAPLGGSTVVLAGTGRGAVSDSAGRFVIAPLDAGGYRLEARRPGFVSLQRLLRVIAGETTSVSLVLTASTQVLGAVRTEARAPDHELFLTTPGLGIMSLAAGSVQAVPRLGEPDILRIVPLLPGVAARNDFSSGYNVHGGESDQNLVLIDGYPIYNPFHLGGLFSTFMESTVRDITLMTSAYPARYGGRLSSVLDVRSAVEGRPGLHGTLEVSMLGSTASLAAPIADRGSWLVAARRTYADWAIGAFSDEVLPYHFYDLHGHALYRLPAGWRLSITGYGGSDVLNADLSELDADSTTSGAAEGTLYFQWGNTVGGVTASQSTPDRYGMDSVVTTIRASRSSFVTTVDAGRGSATVDHSVIDWRLGGDVAAHGTAHRLVLGWEGARYRLRTVDGSPQSGASGTDRRQRATSLSLYAQDLWRPAMESPWLVEGGVRLEMVSSREELLVSPRISVKRFLGEGLAVSAALGRYTQWTHTLSQEDRPLRFFDIYALADSAAPVAAAWHAVTGLERWMGSANQVRVEAWFKRYDRVMEFNLRQDPFVEGDEFEEATGSGYGIDLLFRRYESASRWSGWFAYNYAVAHRRVDGIRFAPAHDRRHNVNVVTTVKLGRYVLGARLGVASGTPYTAIVSQYVRRRFDPVTQRWENPGAPPNDVDYIGGRRNNERYPLTQRLDVSLSREFQRGRTTLRPYLSIVNAYNARNVLDYQLDYGLVPPIRRAFSQYPILPSAGVSIAF